MIPTLSHRHALRRLHCTQNRPHPFHNSLLLFSGRGELEIAGAGAIFEMVSACELSHDIAVELVRILRVRSSAAVLIRPLDQQLRGTLARVCPTLEKFHLLWEGGRYEEGGV